MALFYNALSVELQESTRLVGYILPDNSNLSTLSSQTSALKILREKPVVAHKLLREEKQRVISILHSVSPRNAGIHSMISQAEETIRSHTSTPDTHTQPRPSRSLVIGKDGKSYPMNLTTNYISRFADGFRSCLGCGSVSYLFCEYPKKHNKTMKFKIFRT